ncbi:MAG TPA: hypothetical protein VHL77_03605 [Ferruginibacter sp.]|nr:hypothetical protein [Ferruginibacter sp.]
MQLFLKICLPLLCFIFSAGNAFAQLSVSGTVFDSTKRNYVKHVRVETTQGKFTQTDSMGRYKIAVTENDSLSFIYQNKPTQKFAVKDIADLTQFDISLRVHVKGGYSTLKEVILYAKSYRQDSIENRITYEDVYNYRKPTIRTSISPSGAVGADINEIINMFRFRRNKRLNAFQARLEQQEQDKFVSYRFNKTFVGRITQLKGAELDGFMIRYLPTYEFASTADEVTFNNYILRSSYAYKIELLMQDKRK